MKNLVTRMAQSLVDYPEGVNVTEIAGERMTILELRVDRSDVGKVIGKQGETAKALRTILNAASSKNFRKVLLEIVD